ncbi:HypC/HybG/HupF family hydrogenase formation chaperone [Candidatus Aerophobetes bacterium]|nr:HypC/HybG/HupF family hydrogenase formation chaperone [Candidatus Aerophobetes bacterium]
MCLAIPMKLVSKSGLMGEVEVGGLTRKVNLMLLPEAKVGDYVLVHAGFAISRLEEKEAEEVLSLFSQIEDSNRGREK